MKISNLLITLTATTAIFALGSVHANAATWHRGTPKLFHTNGHIWISNYTKTKEAKLIKTTDERDTTGLSAKYGINITPSYYDANKKYVTSGADESAGAAANPHYKNLGHGYYKLTSGGIGKNSLKNELHNVLGKMYGTTSLVKVFSPTKIKVWTYKSTSGNGKHDKGEIFHRYAAKDAGQILKIK